MSDLGTTFRYTNRQSDLARRPEWKAGDPWSDHYTQTGFDDRDNELEVYLATSVTTRQLVLVDINGNVIATLGSGTTAGSFPTPGPYNELTFLHQDALTTDSKLRWSHPGTPGIEYIMLYGPVDAGGGENRPRIELSIQATETTTRVSSGTKTGAVTTGIDTELSLGSVGGAMITAADGGVAGMQFWSVALPALYLDGSGGDEIGLWTDGDVIHRTAGGTSRGKVYGTTFDEGFLGGNTNIANTGTTLVTLGATTFPFAGYITISATIQAQVLVINDTLIFTIVLDGTPIRQGVWVAGPVVVGTQHTITIFRTIAVGAGSHTVRMDAASGTVNNAYQATANNTGISATYHK